MKTRSIIYLFLYALLLAMGHILQKIVLNQGVDRFTFAFLRITSGFLIISVLVFRQKIRPLQLIRSNARHFVVLGVFFSGCGILLKLWGLSLTTAVNASFIMSLSSLTAILFAFLMLGEKAPRRFYLIAMIMILGVYLVTTRAEQLLPRKGDLILLALVFLIGFMEVYGKKVLRTLSVLETAFGRSFFGMVFLSLLLPFFAPHGFLTIPSIGIFLLALGNGITFSLSIILFYKALQVEGASNSGMFSLLVPVITLILGRFILFERFNKFQIVGGLIIICGSLLISRIKIKQANF